MSQTSLPGSKADILIIDDTPDNLRLLNQMLSAFYKVRLAPSGEVGLTAARSAPPDLILLDVMMPGLSGYEVATQLKAETPTADIPIIFISALNDLESKVHGFTVGGVDYVTKPFQEKEVLARINTHLTLRTLHRQLQAELTARQQIEAALRENEHKYRFVAENTADVIWVVDVAAQRFKYVSPSVAKLRGYTPEEVMAQPISEALTPQSNSHVSELLAIRIPQFLAGIPTPLSFVDEVDQPCKDGSIVQTEVTTTYLLNEAGQLEIVGVSRNITERKRTEAALRESEAKYHKIFNNEIDAICIFDVETGQILDVNNAYLQLYGYSRDEVLALTVADVSAEVENTNAAIQVAKDIGDVVIPERNHRRKDGTIIQVELSAGAYSWNGRTVMFAIARDITARKQAEAQREAALSALRKLNAELEQRVADRTRDLTSANERLAELSSLKTEFITRISHELRTPLANIKLYLQLLEHGKPEKREPYFQTLHEQADRLQHLIEDLLDISQLSLDEIGVHATTLDVNALLHDLISDYTAVALDRGLALTASPTPDRLVLNTDRGLLRQALSNVLTNALNYTPRAGQVTLRVDRVVKPEGEWVAIKIQDTGPGITEHDLLHIFEPFYRGVAAANYKIPGTGVGLPIAQRLIERLGGHITVESSPGQGAAFTIWLRAASA